MDLKKLSFHLFSLGALLIVGPIFTTIYYDSSWICTLVKDPSCAPLHRDYLLHLGVSPTAITWSGIGICVISQIIKFSLPDDKNK